MCSPVDRTAKVVTEPVVIFEVLSPSTAAQDRIVKAREYQATPSVQRYVMLEQDRIGATVHVRAQDGWSVLVLKDEDTLAMPEIGLSVPLAEFYEGLEFGSDSVEGEDNDPAPTRHRLIAFRLHGWMSARILSQSGTRPTTSAVIACTRVFHRLRAATALRLDELLALAQFQGHKPLRIRRSRSIAIGD